MIDKNSFVHKEAGLELPVVISSNAEVHNNTQLGRYSAIGRNSIVYTNTTIGRYCSIGRYVEIGLPRHPVDWLSTHVFQFNKNSFKGDEELDKVNRRRRNELMHPETTIGSDVWVGAKASIASGVKVAPGAVVFANAVVTSDIGPYEKFGGVPARKIGQRFSDEIIADLMALEWWNAPTSILRNVKFEDITTAIEQIKDLHKLLRW